MSTARKQIHRLSDFIIEEVSLVDRAANKRRFLTVKRDDAEGREDLAVLEPDGRGGFRFVAQPNDNGDTTMPIPANVTKGIEAVEQIFYKVGDAVDRLMRVASVVMQADSLKLDGPSMETVAGEIDKVTTSLAEVKAQLGVAKSLLTDAEAGDADAQEAAAKTTDLDATITNLESMAAKLKETAKAKVDKAGAAMSSGRLKRYQGALKELLSVLREVGGDVKSVVSDDTQKSADVDAPAPAAAPSATEQPQPEATSAHSDEELAALKKRDAEQAAELAKLRKENSVLESSPVPSQAIPVESGNPNPTADSFEWPMDMNSELGRARTSGEQSFHG